MIPAHNLFLCGVGEKITILCERHAQAFEVSMLDAEVPHTIYELDPEEAEENCCHACNLQEELTRPRIILPD